MAGEHADLASQSPTPWPLERLIMCSAISCGSTKDRQLFAWNGSAEVLLECLAIRERAPGPLFAPISQRGRLLPRRLTDKAVTWILQDRAQAAEMAAFSPHDLRHTWIRSCSTPTLT